MGDTVSEAQSVEDTGETEVLECGLVLRSIGYQGRDSISNLLARRKYSFFSSEQTKLAIFSQLKTPQHDVDQDHAMT